MSTLWARSPPGTAVLTPFPTTNGSSRLPFVCSCTIHEWAEEYPVLILIPLRGLRFITSPELSVSANLFFLSLISSCFRSGFRPSRPHTPWFTSTLISPCKWSCLQLQREKERPQSSSFRISDSFRSTHLSGLLRHPCFLLQTRWGKAALCNRACGQFKRKNTEIGFGSIKFEIILGYPKRGVGWAMRHVRLRKRFNLEIAKQALLYILFKAISSTKRLLAKQNFSWIHKTFCP